MGNENHRLFGECGEEALVEFAFGFFVERCADLVEQEDGAFAQKPAGDGDTLGLALAEPATAFPELGIEPVGEFVHEVCTGGVQYALQFFVASAWFGEQEVVPYGTAHERVALRDIYEVPAGRFANRLRAARCFLLVARCCFRVAGCARIQGDAPACGFNEPEHKPEKRRLSDASFADEGGFRARPEIVREVLDYFAVAFRIPERHIAEHYAGRAV